jgi:hypothetical protein
MKEALQLAQGVSAPQSTGNTIGMDLGDRWSRYCVLDGNGLLVEEDRVRTTAAGWNSGSKTSQRQGLSWKLGRTRRE